MAMERTQENSQTEIKSDQVAVPIGDAAIESNTHENSQNGTARSATTGRKLEKVEFDDPMVQLSKYILLLATLVATVTYAAGFNPPGGVWQDTDKAAGHLAGDPIIRDTNQTRYLVFFCFNAIAFASSLVVIAVVLFLSLLYETRKIVFTVVPLQAVMVVNLLSIMGAYAASTCRDTLTTIYSSVLVAAVSIYLFNQMVGGKTSSRIARALLNMLGVSLPQGEASNDIVEKKRLRKVLMLLATFAVSVTYVAGMSTPGGFWDNNAENGNRPGDAILKDRYRARLTVFFCCNTMAFVASLLIIVVLLNEKYCVEEAYVWITVALVTLVGAYTSGSCRETDTTVYVVSLVVVVLAFIVVLQLSVVQGRIKPITDITGGLWIKLKDASKRLQKALPPADASTEAIQARSQARSLVLLLATLAATITYQAGLDPPGGVWPDNGDGHMAGDPILLTTNPRRYKAFFYCNSVAFVASLVAIIMVQNDLLLTTHVLEAAMILDLFGLIGAYAAGSCRDVSTSIYAMALAGAVLVYVVIHVVFFTMDQKDADSDIAKIHDQVEKRRKRLLLFAVLAATITYQAGLTPPGGFRLQDDEPGHHAGDPVLLYNFPRRYTAFFYCNSVSFMLSIALIILLVNPHLYRPAIRSYALAVCTGAGMFGLMGAYAAGSTQYLKTSIYILLAAVVLLVVVILFLVFLKHPDTKPSEKTAGDPEDKETHAKRKYLMLLGILVASVTYQAGLEPPGGAWQQSSGGHYAGNPVLRDSSRPRYRTFFYSNSTSFVASIVVIILLVVQRLKKKKDLSLEVMSTAILLDLLALLVAYAAGSSRGWKTSVYVVALVIAVLAYVAFHIALACLCAYYKRQAFARRPRQSDAQVAPVTSSPSR